MTRTKNKKDHQASARSGSTTFAVLLIAVLLAGGLALYTFSSVQAASLAATQQVSDDTNSPDEKSADDAKTTTESDESGSFYTDVGERPDWVKQGHVFDTENQVEFLVVQSEPRLKQREAEEELEERLVEVVREKVDEMFAPGAGKAIGINLEYIREHLVQRNEQCDGNGVYNQLLRWTVPEANRQMLQSDTRDAYQCFSQVRLDSEFKNRADAQWKNQLVVSRTMQIGIIAMSTLVVLTLAFGYFTANHKTRGFYSRRLQTVGIGFLLAAAAVVWYLATQFAWL